MLGGIRVARRNSTRDRFVFLDGSGYHIEEDTDVEPSITLALRLDSSVERQNPGSDHAFHVRPVKRQIQIEVVACVPRVAATAAESSIEGTQLDNECAAPGRGQRGRHTSCESLEMSDDREQLLSVVERQRCSDETSLLPLTECCDKPFLLESVQCASDGRAAESEPFGDGALGDERSWRQVPPDNGRAQVAIGKRDVVERRLWRCPIVTGCGERDGRRGR